MTTKTSSTIHLKFRGVVNAELNKVIPDEPALHNRKKSVKSK